jgi:hypothetical protein
MFAVKRVRVMVAHKPFVSGARLVRTWPEIRNYLGPERGSSLAYGSARVKMHRSCLSAYSFEENNNGATYGAEEL